MSEAYAEDLRNSRDDPDERETEVGGIAADRVVDWAARISRLEEERKALSGDISDIYKEIKSAGIPPKEFKQALRLREMDANKKSEHDYWLDALRRVLGA